MTTAKVAKSSGRGSKPGEHRGGRKAGTPNKATAVVRDIAGQYTEQAVTTLVGILAGGEGIPAAAQVAAAKELLDRAHGKPGQSVDITGDMTFKGLEVIVRR
jgi:hypothetical protein